MAVQLTYQFSLNDNEENIEKKISEYWLERSSEDELNKDFYIRLVKGVSNSLPDLDAKIEQTLENWKFSRIDKVDLAVLRVAAYELLFDEESSKLDVPIILNEAVEISKKYGAKESSVFINGILDRIAQLRNTV
jgi:N utilization substance protein B